MNNLTRPSSPQSIAFHPESDTPQTSWGVHEDFSGFTKLEYAALMMAQGFVSCGKNIISDGEIIPVHIMAVQLAKDILEESNK